MKTKTRPWRHTYHDIEIPRPKNYDIEIPRQKSHDIEFLWNSDSYDPCYSPEPTLRSMDFRAPKEEIFQPC